MMQTDMTKVTNKTAKRRCRNKRRKQHKQKSDTTKTTASTKRSHQHFGHGNTKLPQHLFKHCQQQESKCHERGLQIWRQTYEAAVRWHSNHQMNYWRQRAEQLQEKNDCLEMRLAGMENSVADVYETSSDEEPEDDDEDEQEENDEPETDVDEDYLKFVAVTQKHREELRLAREQNSLQPQT